MKSTIKSNLESLESMANNSVLVNEEISLIEKSKVLKLDSETKGDIEIAYTDYSGQAIFSDGTRRDMRDEFHEITRSKEEIITRVENIAYVSEEMSATAEEVAASSEKFNSASNEVSGAAQNLTELTSTLKLGISKYKC
ncbi:hypothetical protein [Clostridium paraputrificum]|uniref:Methyl-accepting transducer domain-containing protein n=1 Tax=Clostridium paraputrificum TaxID=29363 RepID=A0A6N3C5Y3_9CLOT